MSEAVKSLLFTMRQHPGFQDLLKAFDPPQMPRFKKGETLETYGARAAIISGMRDQHERVVAFLTGASQESNSEQEQL